MPCPSTEHADQFSSLDDRGENDVKGTTVILAKSLSPRRMWMERWA